MTQNMPPRTSKYSDDWVRKNVIFYDSQALNEGKRGENLVLNPTFFERQWDSYRDAYRKIAALGDAHVLDCGCGTGMVTCWAAQNGAFSVGIDVSRVSLQVARNRALANNMPSAQYANASIYQLPFADSSFDAIVGIDVLHHLNIEDAAVEMSRVLRNGGTAFFHEQVAFSKVLRGIRRSALAQAIVPIRAVEGEKELDEQDLKVLRAYFTTVRVTGYHLLSRLDRLMPWRRFTRVLHRIDRRLLGTFPSLTKCARMAIVELRK